MIIVANWKSSLPEDLDKYLENVNKDIIIAPVTSHLSMIRDFKIAAQNVMIPKSTGELSVDILKKLNIEYCIVGHLERRKYFFESRRESHDKCEALLNEGITPILCIDNNTMDQDLAFIEGKDDIIIAYEPQASIGTDKLAGVEIVETALKKIRAIVDNRVLYGGSINSDNYSKMLGIGLDGFLVGNASLSYESINKIMEGCLK